MDRLEITITWHGTVLDVRHLRPGDALEIAADDAVLGGLLPEGWRLAELREGAARVRTPGGADAQVLRAGVVEPVASDEPVGLVLKGRDRARLRLGDATVYFAVVPEAPAIPPLRRARALWAGGEARSLGAAAVLHGLFFALALSVPMDADSLTLDAMEARPAWVDVALRPEVVKADPTKAETPEDGDEPTGGGPSDLADRVDLPQTAPDAQPEAGERLDKKTQAIQVAGAVSAGVEDALGEVMGAPSLGLVASNALSQLNGTPEGQSMGLLGQPDGDPLGSPWGTPGGKGPGTTGKSVGIKGLDRSDFRRDRPGPPKRAPGPAGTRTPKGPKATVVPLDPKVSDGLSREEIQRVIRKFRARYRYCYEKALQAEKGLNGKVRTKFTIGPEGTVIAAFIEGSTLDHPEVEACLVRQLKRTAFPAPRGRGVVVVRYPFLFKRSGG